MFDVNPDGTLPEPRKHKKAYQPLPDRTEEVRAAIDAELARSKNPGHR